MGYKANPRECIAQMIADKEQRQNKRLEELHDYGLAKRNNTSKEMHFNNVFENYFSESVVKNIERLLMQDKIEAEEAERLKFESANPQQEEVNEQLYVAPKIVISKNAPVPQGLAHLISEVENKYR